MTTETATPNQADASTAFLRAARAGQIDKILALLGQDVDINVSNANGLNAIHLAAKDGHASVVDELIARGASIDAATNKGNTALHIASLAGQEQVVKLLVQHGAQVNIQSQNGFTPLYMAAQENHDAVVKFLLANGANQTLATEDGFTPLAVAMQQGHERVVAVLLEADSRGRVRLPALHIAAKKDDVKAATLLLENEHNPDVTSKSGFTPLHIAAHYGNEAVARLLLARGADVNCTAKHNICPLHVAAKWGKEHMVCLLCERGACVDARTRDGLTPLHCAARSGHERVVDALLERGAPIAGRSKNGLAPLHMAAQGDHAEAARALLTRRAPVDDLTVDYLTALHVAAHCGHAKVAKLLLDRNADANARALNGFTPLHIACKKNRMKVVELLLKYGAFISATTESGLTPLHVAAFMGCMSIVIYLLQHDAAPDAPTVRGETPLHLAARANQTDIIRILLRNGACVEARAREQHTPLHIGARLGNADIAALLLQHGAKAETQTSDGYNALHIAAKQHNHDVAAVLLEHGAPVTATTKKGFTPLHLAAKYGNLKVANLLLKHGAPADVSGKNGVTPLHVAAQYDQQAVAGALMERGADAKAAAKNGHTPLHIAARKNQMETAGILLEHGADPAAQSRAGFQPLHLAAQQGHLEMCSLLLEAGAESGGQARNGLSPLHLAAQEDRATVAKLLLKNEAKVDARTKGGYTALHVASHFGQAAAARELLDSDADVNSKTEYGYTALHHAAQQGHINIVNLLLDHKANPNETTNNGQTALDIASRLGYVTVLQRLKEAGGDCAAITPSAERYKVVAPETMHETFMSDSEEEGGDDTLLTEQPYRYLTADDMKSLGDDSLPIDVTRDERADSAAGPNNIMEMSQGSTGPRFPSEDIVVKNVNHLYNAEHPGEGYCYNVDTALPKKKLQWKSFMVSFLVDARGGAMRGSRGGGVKVVVPPLSAQQPTRITCRYLKPTRINNMPPLMEGEALASRVLEMGPVSAKFLGPVIIEVPHYAALRGGERELVILRSDNGCNWREHAADATGDLAHQILNDSLNIEDGGTAEESTNGAFNRTTRILTHDFPQYFAVISRIRQEVHAIGPEGGTVSSSVVPQVQAVFPQGALTKKIKVGLQAQTIESELTAKMLGRGVAVSPVVTVEPRRRKFHKAITLSMPAPRAHTHGMINNYAGSAPTLRLLCSISGGTNRAHWEDVTENTPLTFVGDCVSFTTTVSARYWLIDCRNVADAAKMATELYREAIHVPFIARFVVYARAKDTRDAELRAFCVTDDREDKTLERLERFTQVAKSRDVEVHEGKSVYVELCGNLSCVSGGADGGGERPALAFRAFRENRLSINAIRRSADDDAVARCRFLRDAKPPANGEPAPPPVCVLNIVIPELTGDYSEHEESTASVDDAAWRQKLSDPGLWEVCRLLGRDWVPLAYELGLSAATVNQIQSKGGDATAHAALMLKLWRTQSGPKTQENQLELALCCIGRDDIMLPSSEQETERRIQRNVYQERQAEEDLSRAADTTDTNRLSAATDEMESIMETSLGADEAKYSPEEKAIHDDRTPSPTEGSDDEGYERSVAERKEQIERKLSTTRVPSSKQKREIREEISEIKRHSKTPEIVKLHESVAADNTQYNVVQQVSIEQMTLKEEFADKTEINITQMMNEDISFVREEQKQAESSIIKKFDASAQKQTPKHLQKHARQDSMIRFSSGDFSDIKVASKKGQSTEVCDISQHFLEKQSEMSSGTSDATVPKEIVTSVIIEKHDIEESSEGDKSPELVAEYTERDLAEAPLREKINSFENKMQHPLNGDSSKTQTQVTLTKEALKKHTQDYEQTVEYTQEFVRDQSRQSVEKTEIVEEIFETSTKDTEVEEVVDTIQSVKEKIQRFDSRVRQQSISTEEKSGKFAKAMRTDSTIVQVSSEEDAEFMKKSTESETETESQTTVRIDKSLAITKAPVAAQNGLSDHKETPKDVQEQTRSDLSPDLSQYTKKDATIILEENTAAKGEQKLAEDNIAPRSQLLTADSLGSDPLDSPAHGNSRDSPAPELLGSDPLDSFGLGISQDSPAPELTDSLRVDQDVSTTQTDSKIYSKDSKHGQSDSLDEASQFSELDEGQSSGASPAHRLPVNGTSTNIRSQTSYFLELESQYSAQINAPKPSEQKISPKESPVISAKARQFIETVPEEDSVQECFFSKRIYSDSLEDSDHTDSRRHSEADSLKSDQSDLKLKISSDFDERAEYEENVDSGSGFGDEKFEESVGFTSMNVEPIEDYAPCSTIEHTDISKGTEECSSTKVIVSENIENETIFKKVGPSKRHSRTESISMTKGFQEDISEANETSKPVVQECQIIVTEADDSIIDDRVSSFEKEDISDKISSESSREIEMRSSDGITSGDAVTERKSSSDEEMLKYEDHIFSPETEYLNKQREGAVSPVESIHGSVKDLQKMDFKIQSLKNDLADKAVHGPAVAPSSDEKRHSVTSGGSVGALFPSEKRPSDAASLTESRDYTFDESEDSFGYDPSHDLKGKAKAVVVTESIPEQSQVAHCPQPAIARGDSLDDVEAVPEDHAPIKLMTHIHGIIQPLFEEELEKDNQENYALPPKDIELPATAVKQLVMTVKQESIRSDLTVSTSVSVDTPEDLVAGEKFEQSKKTVSLQKVIHADLPMAEIIVAEEINVMESSQGIGQTFTSKSTLVSETIIKPENSEILDEDKFTDSVINEKLITEVKNTSDRNVVNVTEMKTSDFEKLTDATISKDDANKDIKTSASQKNGELDVSKHKEVTMSEFATTDLTKGIITEIKTFTSEKTFMSGHSGMKEDFIKVGPIVEIKIDEAPDIVRGESLDEFIPLTDAKISETVSTDLNKSVSETVDKTSIESKVYEKELDIETEILIQELIDTGYVSKVEKKEDEKIPTKSRVIDDAKLDKDILDTEVDETEDFALDTEYIDPEISKDTVSVDSIIEEAVIKVEEYLDAEKVGPSAEQSPTSFGKSFAKDAQQEDESKSIQVKSFSVQSSPDDVEEKNYTDSESDMDRAKVLEIIEPPSDAEIPLPFSSFDTKKIRTDSLDDADELFQEREVEFLPEKDAYVTRQRGTTSTKSSHIPHSLEQRADSDVSYPRVIPPTIGIIRADSDVKEMSEESDVTMKKNHVLEKRTSSEVSKSTESVATVISMSAKSFEDDTKSIVEEDNQDTNTVYEIEESGKLKDISEARVSTDKAISEIETAHVTKVKFEDSPSISYTDVTEVGSEHIKEYENSGNVIEHTKVELGETLPQSSTKTMQQKSFESHDVMGKITGKHEVLSEIRKTEHSVDEKKVSSTEVKGISKFIEISGEKLVDHDRKDVTTHHNSHPTKESQESEVPLYMTSKVDDCQVTDVSKVKVDEINIKSSDYGDKFTTETEPKYVDSDKEQQVSDTKISTKMVQNHSKDDSKVDVDVKTEEKSQKKISLSTKGSPEDDRDTILEDMKDLNRLDRRCSDLLEGMSQQQGALVRIDAPYVIHDLSLKFSKTPPSSPVDLVALEKANGKASGLQPKGPDSTSSLDTSVTVRRLSAGSPRDSVSRAHAPSSSSAGGGDSFWSDTDAMQSEMLTEASKVLTAAASPKSPTRHLADHLSFVNVDRPTVTSGAIELVDRTIAKSIDVIDQIKMEQLAAKEEKDKFIAEKEQENKVQNAMKEQEKNVEKEEQLELIAKKEWLESGIRAQQLELDAKVATDKHKAIETKISTESKVSDTFERSESTTEIKVDDEIESLEQSEFKKIDKVIENLQLNDNTVNSESKEKSHETFLPKRENQQYEFKYTSSIDDEQQTTLKEKFESVVTVKQISLTKVGETTKSTEQTLTEIDRVKMLTDVSELTDLKFEKIGKEIPFPCIQHQTPDGFSTILTHEEIETHKISGQEFFSQTKHVSSSDDDSLIIKTETKHEVQGQEEQVKVKTTMRKDGDDMELKTNKLEKAQEVTATRLDTEIKAAFKGTDTSDIVLVEREFQQQGLYSGRQTKSEEKMTALKDDLLIKSNELKYSERDLSHEQWGKEYFEESGLEDLKEHDDEDKSEHREAYESTTKIAEKDEASYSEEVSEKGKIVSSTTNYSKEESYLESKERDDLSSDISHETSFKSETVEKQDSMEKSDMSPKSRSKSFKKDNEVYEVGFITEIKVSSSPGKKISRTGSQDTQSESEISAESPVPPQEAKDYITEKHSPIKQSREQFQDHVWEASDQKPESFEMALEFTQEIDESFQIKSAMTKSTDSSDTLIENKELASKITDFGDLKIRLSESSSAMEETGFRDVHSEEFDSSKDIMIKSGESMETEYMVKSLESHEGEALQKSMDSVSAEALHASEFSDSALHTTLTDPKKEEMGRMIKEKSLEDICSSGYDTDLSSAEFHAAKLESDRGDSDVTRTPQRLADLSVLEKTIDEVKQSLEAAQGEIISEKSDGSSKYKQSPSEFEFKLISPDKPAVIAEEPIQVGESSIISKSFENEVIKMIKAEKDLMTSSLDEATLSEEKDTILEKESKSYTYDTSEPSIRSESGPHSILETETEIVLSDIDDSSKESPEVKLRPNHTHVRSRLFAGDRRSASEVEGWSSSGESHYQSFEHTESQHSSRPLSSDVENITTGQSTGDYETAQMTQDISSRSLKNSKEFYTAASSITSRDSMRSLDSDGSSHLASIDISDASETLVPSANELKEELMESGTFSDQFFHDDARRINTLALEESLELELLDEPTDGRSDEAENQEKGYKLEESTSAESVSKMKRSHEMRFQQKELSPEKPFLESYTDDVSIFISKNTKEEFTTEPIVTADEFSPTSTSEKVITKKTLRSTEIVTENKLIKTTPRVSIPETEEQILVKLTDQIVWEGSQECEGIKPSEFLPPNTNTSDEVIEKKPQSEAYTIDSKQSSSSSLKIQEHEPSAPHTPLSIPSQSSESTDNGREYVLDDMYEISETPELFYKDRTITDSKSELSVTTEEQTLFEASLYEKDQDSPASDEFEIVDKPSEMDDFVVIEEVAKEAQETDMEGKSLHIAQVKYEKKHDEEVEEYLSKTSKKQDSEYSTSGSLSEEEMASYELEQKRLQAAELAEIEAGKKWVQMQFEGDARYEYERVPLEDIKEEEMADFDASRMGSLSSQKESIGSYGSFKNSFGSLSDSEMGSRRRFMVKGEQDDVSISSLQEFENLEQALMEQYQQHSSSSQDSLNGSLPRRYLLSKNGQGDDISISSLKEFEGLEKECIEALKLEIEAKKKEALLLSKDVKELSSGFLESERRSYSGGSSESSPPQKSESPVMKSGSSSSGKSDSPGQKSPAQKYGSPSQKALVESAIMKKLIDQQMALDAKVEQARYTSVKPGPTVITVQKKKFDERGAFFATETQTQETECKEPDCIKQTSYECKDTKEQHRISDESLAGDCEEMMKMLEKQESEKQHTDFETTATVKVIKTSTVTQKKYIDGKLISENVTSLHSPKGMDIPGARMHEEIGESASYRSLEMESSRSLTSEISTSATSQISNMDSIVTLLEHPYSLESGDSSSTTQTSIITVRRRPNSMELEKTEPLDLGSSDNEVIIKEVLSPMSGRSSQTVISTSGKQLTDPASGSWSGQEEDMSSSGSFSRGGRCEIMLGSMDSLEASSSNATRATYNYEVDTPMTGSLTSGGSNTMVSSLDAMDPVTAMYAEGSVHVEGNSYSDHGDNSHVQDSDTERQEMDSQAPRAKERTVMFDSTDTLSGGEAGREVDAVATFYIGDTPIVRGAERFDTSEDPEPSSAVLSGSAPASLPTLPVTPPVPAQRRSLTATSLAKSAMSEEDGVRKG